MHRLTQISCRTAALALAAGLVASACGSSDKGGSGDGNGNSAGSANATGGHAGNSSSSAGSSAQTGGGSSNGGSSTVGSGGSSAASGAGTTGVISTDACPGLPFDGSGEGGEGGAGSTACTGVSVETEAVPVDMFIMMDSSVSLNNLVADGSMTRWDALKAAVQSFATAQSASAIGAGIGFFPYSGGNDDTLDCNASNYAKPAVGIGPLSTTGAQLVKAIGDLTPGGLTPTVPALQGALTYAKSWATAHAGRATIVVLVTDGFPTQCGGAPSDVADAAAAAYDVAPFIKTYVIGVGDVAKFNLDNYAQSGGTQKAFLTDSANVSSTFVQALLNISDSRLACEYAIPKPAAANMQVDPDKVQIVYTPASGDPLEVPKVTTLGGCATSPHGGWYYDNPAAPTKISVCPCTCASFAAGRVDVRLGCSPRISIR